MSEVPAETVAPDNEMTENADQAGRVIKGRGQASSFDEEENRYTGKGAQFEGLASDAKEGEPVKSIEGWIIFLTGVHEEAEEDQLMDKMSEYGSIRNFQLQLDRRTGFVKGYALVEYEKKEEAEAAIAGVDGKEFMEATLRANWAFVAAPNTRS